MTPAAADSGPVQLTQGGELLQGQRIPFHLDVDVITVVVDPDLHITPPNQPAGLSLKSSQGPPRQMPP